MWSLQEKLFTNEIQRLRALNETLKQENETLRNNYNAQVRAYNNLSKELKAKRMAFYPPKTWVIKESE